MILLKTKALRMPLLVIFIALTLCSCAIFKKSPALVNTSVKLSSSADLNPNLFGRPSPLYVTIFQLIQPETFNQTDFFVLQSQPAQILGKDLLAQTTLLITPNMTRQINLPLDPKVRYLGIMAAYTQLDAGQWRLALPIKPGSSTLHLQFNQTGVKAIRG